MDSNYKAFFEFACCWLKEKKQFAYGGVTFLVMLFGLLATSSSANDLASHEFLGWQKLTDYSNVLSEVDVQNSVMNFGAFSTCPKPSSGTAKIDGNYSEWDLTNDFFADMYEAGKVDKTLLSKLYVRYDCKTQKLCVLVKTVDGHIAEKSPDDAFLKFGNTTKIVDGNSGSSNFRWIYKNGKLVGFEACGKVAPGSYNNLNVHLQVKMDRTSAVSMRMIPICLDECPCEFAIECPKKWQGGGKPCDFVAPEFKTLKDFHALGGEIISSCDDVYVKSYSSDGGACAGWLKKMMTLTDGKNEHTCVVQWDFKKDDLTIECPRPVDIACKTQEEIDKKFKWWLNEYKVAGACEGYTVNTEPKNPQAPIACEGGYVKVKFIVIDGCGRKQYCESSFKVRKPEPVDAWAPKDLVVDYCLSQKVVDGKFAEWLAAFGAKGGCDLHYEIYVVEGKGPEQKPGEKPVAPDNCGGYVKVKISAYDNLCLQNGDEDYAIFTVKRAPKLVLKDPGDKYLEACLSQKEVNEAFKAWLMEFSAEGGCGTVSSDLWDYKAPSNCGGKVEVEFWAYDKCRQRKSVTRTFGVKRAPILDYKCPPDYTIKACKSQDEVNEAFRKWLTGFMVTGGCAPKYPDVWQYKAPPACGGSVEVKFWITDRCSKEVGCNKTFTVEPAPELVVYCPGDYKVPACTNQAKIDEAFKTWLGKFYTRGGCNPQSGFSNFDDPKSCGSKSEVIYYAKDECGAVKRCTSTFYVVQPDPLTVYCPGDYRVPACADQAKIDEAFKTWLGKFYTRGGCNPNSGFSKYDEPKACGSKSEVIYFAKDDCGTVKRCTSTFYVVEPHPLTVYCPGDYKVPACTDQAKIDELFEKWLSQFSTKGGCNPKSGFNQYVEPKTCGSKSEVIYFSRDECNQVKRCTSYFYVPEPETLEVYCPGDYRVPACTDQARIDEIFKKWLSQFSTRGGCNPNSGFNKFEEPRMCGSKSEVIYFSRDECNQVKRCTSYFYVPEPETLEVYCPGDYKVPACTDQARIDELFKKWLSQFSTTGGCKPKSGFNQYIEPKMCGSTSEVIYFSRDECNQVKRCTSYFYVAEPETLVVYCPGDYKVPACTDQTRIDEIFKKWLSQFSTTGGCKPKSGFNKYVEPKMCGSTSEVIYFSRDECNQVKRCTSYFYVAEPDKLEVKCAPDMKVEACKSQDEVNEIFKKWLAGFSTYGGCKPKSDFKIDQRPQACGSTTKIIYYAVDACEQKAECTAYFYVAEPTKLEVKCAPNYTQPACSSQEEVDQAFKRWLSLFKVEGGCYPEAKFNQYEHPNACGSKTEVIFYAKDKCDQEARCSAVFYVERAPELKVKCAPDMKVEACKSQDEVNELFKAWLAEFKTYGGCKPESNFKIDQRPQACGSTTKVIYYAKDACEQKAECTAYFYVAKPDELKAICPQPFTAPACYTQEEIEMAFKRWINIFRVEGGCNPESTPLDKYEAPNVCGGVVKIRFETKDICEMYDYCETYFKVDEREDIEVLCPEDEKADADQTPAQVAAEWEAWLDKFMVKAPCKETTEVKYYLNGKEVASLTELKKLVPDACGSDDQVVKVMAYDECSKDYCEAKFYVEETFQRLILSLPDDEKLCFPGKYAPTKEDLPAPLTKEEVLKALTVPNCVMPVIPTFTIMVMGPEITGDVYKFTRIYKVQAGPLSTQEAEIIELVWDIKAPVFKGIPGTQLIPCGSEPPAWPTVTAEDGYGRSVKIIRKQEKSFILCGGTYWIRTWIASDECGNVARRSQKIYYKDDAPPVLEVPDDVTVYCPGEIPEATYEAYDDCSDIRVEFEEKRKDQNDCEYTITRTWTAYDGCGKKTVKSQVITVIDNEAPVIKPTNPMLVDMPMGGEMITYNCDAPAITMGDVEVYDGCCNDFTVETKDELIANATCDVFGYYRKWKCSVTATDVAGNVSEYYFYVLQYDTTAPEILNVPEDIELGCNDTIPHPATDVEVSDNCSLEKVAEYREEVFFDPQDSSKYGIVRTWHSTDHCGNYGEDYQIIAKCGFDVSLIDAKLGNSVWLDENGNGLQETEEPGIDGVTVYLYEVRVVGGETKTTKIDSTVTTTIDGNAGQYEFGELVRGTYQLEFAQPDGMEFTIPFEGVDATNSDVDPRTGFTKEIELGFGQRRMEFDAGFLKGPLFDAAPLADYNFEANEPVVEIDDISVFPNPTTALINVTMDIAEDGRVQLNIVDQLGQIVLTETRNLNRGKQTETIDLHAIPAGTYLLNVKMSDRSITKMIIRN